MKVVHAAPMLGAWRRFGARWAAALVALVPATATGAPEQYVEMRDGVLIAISIHTPAGFPEGYDPSDPDRLRYPAIFEMSGYDGASAEGRSLLGEAVDLAWDPLTGESFEEPVETGLAILSDSLQLTSTFLDRYVVVHASVRGTGCSGGEFDIYSLESALDGWELVEWIAEQPWSNGDVAIFGHSYSGMTGFMVAATQPPSLRAVSVSGLIEDTYRGILYPGGVSNYGFPLLWSAMIRPLSDLIGGTLPGLIRPLDEEDDPRRAEICGEHVVSRPLDPSRHPIFRAGSSEFDTDWYRSTALISYLNGDIRDYAVTPDPRSIERFGIDVPIHITAAYADEQTGGRGPTALWDRVGAQCDAAGCSEVPVPKRLLLTNGDHNTQNPKFSGPLVLDERRGWIDHWMGLGGDDYPERSVGVLLEKRKLGSGHSPPLGGRLEAGCGAGGEPGNEHEPCFPLPGTQWTPLYLRADGSLVEEPPTDLAASQSYLAGPVGRQSWFYATWSAGLDLGTTLTTSPGPDELVFRTAAAGEDETLAGPLVARIWASTGMESDNQFAGADLFLQLLDEAPDGSLSWLQRGMLRMRHQPVVPTSPRNDVYDGVTYRWWRPHTEEATMAYLAATDLSAPNPYDIEIWPLGHVQRQGHRLVLKIHAAPAIDEYYAYVPRHTPLSEVTIYHDAAHPSHLIVPRVPTPELAAAEPACGEQEGVRCVPPGSP